MTVEDKLNQNVLIKKLKTLQKTKKIKITALFQTGKDLKEIQNNLSDGIKLFRIKMHQNF